MKENKKIFELMNVLTILLVAVVTVTGVLSFSTSHSYEVTNQYGDSVKMWGYGIYKNDSFFKGLPEAPGHVWDAHPAPA